MNLRSLPMNYVLVPTPSMAAFWMLKYPLQVRNGSRSDTIYLVKSGQLKVLHQSTTATLGFTHLLSSHGTHCCAPIAGDGG